jgi:putative intracellular protease/amidase
MVMSPQVRTRRKLPCQSKTSCVAETTTPYVTFKNAGFDIQFATEKGASPECDVKLLEGPVQKLMGATQTVKDEYAKLKQTPAWQNPLSWTSSDFSLDPFDVVYIPGGHEKGMKQLLDSPTAQTHIASYFPQTQKPSTKHVVSMCHGPILLAHAKGPDGKPIIHDATLTAFTGAYESAAYAVSAPFLGDYVKTYGPGSDTVEEIVKKGLDDPRQFVANQNPLPFVHVDGKYNLVTARYPPDAQTLADKAVEVVQANLAAA